MNKGILYAASAFLCWGLFPIYFKMLKQFPPAELLLHRMLWSLLFLMLLLALRKQWAWLSLVVRRPKVLASFALSATVLSVNWFIYIWAIDHNRVVDASLGYFVTPLVNVMLGYVLLKERMRPIQWLAIALAACAVLWMTWQAGQFPWIPLALALSFGTYGLLRKTAALGTLEGLSLEILLLTPPALAYLAWLNWQGANSFPDASTPLQILLVLAGPVTAIPLLLFAASARQISLATLGMLQYITPSLQLILGVYLYHEPFDTARIGGFILTWVALILYTADTLWHSKIQVLKETN
jgi:chloramphenicol-sensitive protein RarD